MSRFFIIAATVILLAHGVGTTATACDTSPAGYTQQYVAIGTPRPQFRAFAPLRRSLYWLGQNVRPTGHVQRYVPANQWPAYRRYH